MIATTLEMANEGLEYGSIVRYIFSFPLPHASSVLLFLCRTYVHPYSYATYNHPTLYAFFTIKNQTYLLELHFLYQQKLEKEEVSFYIVLMYRTIYNRRVAGEFQNIFMTST